MMRRRPPIAEILALLVSLLVLSGASCLPTSPAARPPNSGSAWTRIAVHVAVTDDLGPVVGAKVAIDASAALTDDAGVARLTVPRALRDAIVVLEADGHRRREVGVALDGRPKIGDEAVRLELARELPPDPVPPLEPWKLKTVAELRAWQGAISTVLLDLPCGPRPGAADNYLFTAEVGTNPCYSDADRARAIGAYPYTHWAMNPIASKGYHGWWSDTDYRQNPDVYLDRVEQLWRAGKIPAIFLLPDNGVCADGSTIDRACVERELEPIFRSPRFQSLARIVVLAWEPDYRADDWQWGVSWMARVFPDALRYIHFQSGHGAPGRGSELAEAGGPYATEGSMWIPVAPYVHGFLLQDTWTFGGETDEGRTPLEQFEYNLRDFVRRFQHGYAGWPTAGAGGAPVDVVAFEYGSYYVAVDRSQGSPATVAARAREWGAAALRIPGVAGYGDGGPVR